MNGFWKKTGKRFSSALLALVLVLSLMPAAMAVDCENGEHVGPVVTERSEPTCITDGY